MIAESLRAAMVEWDRIRAEAARLYPDLTPSELDRITGAVMSRKLGLEVP